MFRENFPQFIYGVCPSEGQDRELEQEEEKPFDRNGWNYTEDDIERLAKKMEQKMGFASEEFLKLREELGGKGISIKMCEFLSELSKGYFYVPPWAKFNPRSFIDKHIRYRGREKYKVRSSDKDEDWLEPGSGIYPTYDLAEIKEYKEHYLEVLKRPYIIQEKGDGWGVVVDVDCSEILEEMGVQQPVIRIASGRIMNFTDDVLIDTRLRYSSPTYDMESVIEIRDSKGTLIVSPNAPYYINKAATLYGINFDFRNLSRITYQSIKALDLNFGMQLELGIEPKKYGEKKNLYQLRPSPKNIRGKFKKKEDEMSQMEIMATSARVNRVFNVKGELLRQFSIAGLAEKGFEVIRASKNEQELTEITQSRPKEANKILLCSIPVDEALHGAYFFLGAYLEGITGFIIDGSIRPNYSHGGVVLDPEFDRIYNFLDSAGVGMISINNDEKRALESKRSDSVRMLSDGIVGVVGLSKD